MKIAALISQGIVAALTLTAFVMLLVESDAFAAIPFVFLLCSVVTVVGLIRPFGPLARWFVIAVNFVFVLVSVVAIAGVLLLPLVPQGQPIIGAVIAILVFALPYSFSILAIYRQSLIAKPSAKHAA